MFSFSCIQSKTTVTFLLEKCSDCSVMFNCSGSVHIIWYCDSYTRVSTKTMHVRNLLASSPRSSFFFLQVKKAERRGGDEAGNLYYHAPDHRPQIVVNLHNFCCIGYNSFTTYIIRTFVRVIASLILEIVAEASKGVCILLL